MILAIKKKKRKKKKLAILEGGWRRAKHEAFSQTEEVGLGWASSWEGAGHAGRHRNEPEEGARGSWVSCLPAGESQGVSSKECREQTPRL